MNKIDEIFYEHNEKIKQASKRYDGYPVKKGDKELKNAIYTAIMEVMPEKKKPTAGIDQNMLSYPDMGYNQAITDITTSLNELFGRE